MPGDKGNPEDCTASKVMWHLLRKSRRVVLGLELGLCAILRQKVALKLLVAPPGPWTQAGMEVQCVSLAMMNGQGQRPTLSQSVTYCAGVTVSQSSLPGSVCLSTESRSDSADGFVSASSFSDCCEAIVTPCPGGRREPRCHELCTMHTFQHHRAQ